jgi:xylan 1,4-beta-xylosidase
MGTAGTSPRIYWDMSSQKKGALFLFAVAAGFQALASQAPELRAVHVDAAKVTGKIRSFQGVGGGPAPLVPGKLPDVTKQYQDLRIDLVRTHDFFGPTDIDAKWPVLESIPKAVGASGEKSIFRDWKADPEDERSYNFGPSDRLIQAIVNSGAEVYYRLGRSFGADSSPPPDFDKFANVCKHVAMHYNGSWAHGYHDKIRYWELWNEPDIPKPHNPNFFPGFPDFPGFWNGTPAQFYRLYEKVAQALKSYDPNLMVGACGKAASDREGPYRKGLIEYCAAHKVPLDLYSWHHYHNAPTNPYDMVSIGKEIRQLLDTNGFTRAESHVSEWNLSRTNPGRQNPNSVDSAAFVASALIYLQDSAVDRALFYRGEASSTSLLDMRGGYRKKAYAFKAAGMMLDTLQRLAATGGDNQDFAVLAGRSADGTKIQVLISNFRSNRGYALIFDNLPWGEGGRFSVKRYRISANEDFTPIESMPGEIKTEIPSPGVELIVLEKQ